MQYTTEVAFSVKTRDPRTLSKGTTGPEFSGYGQPRSLGMSVRKTDDDRKAVLNNFILNLNYNHDH